MLQPDNPDKVLKGGQLGAVKNGQPDELHRVWHQVAVCTYPHLSKPHLGRFKIQVAQGYIQSRSKNGRSGLEKYHCSIWIILITLVIVNITSRVKTCISLQIWCGKSMNTILGERNPCGFKSHFCDSEGNSIQSCNQTVQIRYSPA